MLLLDFKENIIFRKGPREFNVDFYNRKPRTVFGIVAFYRKNDDKIYKRHFNIISEILNHDSLFAQNSIEKIIKSEPEFFLNSDI